MKKLHMKDNVLLRLYSEPETTVGHPKKFTNLFLFLVYSNKKSRVV